MSTIAINDLVDNRNLNTEELAAVNGGWYWLYQPIYNYGSYSYYNPFVASMQNSWAARGNAFDASHNSFIDYLRS
ncbi:MAG: hypothetical protein ACK5HY_15025 [Parahaliea sp.]